MAKHPTSRRVHRESSDDDAFVTGVLETTAWAKTHNRAIVIGGVTLAVVIGGFLYYQNHRSFMNDRAAAELTTARQTLLEGNRQLAMKDLATFVSTYGSTAAAGEARLMLGQVYLEEGKPAEAIKTLEPIAKDVGEGVGASAALILGAAFEMAKRLDDADRTYLRIADGARHGFEKREALERAATLRLEKGNAKGAAELYERAMKTLPEDSPERSGYQMRIAETTAGTPAGGS